MISYFVGGIYAYVPMLIRGKGSQGVLWVQVMPREQGNLLEDMWVTSVEAQDVGVSTILIKVVSQRYFLSNVVSRCLPHCVLCHGNSYEQVVVIIQVFKNPCQGQSDWGRQSIHGYIIDNNKNASVGLSSSSVSDYYQSRLVLTVVCMIKLVARLFYKKRVKL